MAPVGSVHHSARKPRSFLLFLREAALIWLQFWLLSHLKGAKLLWLLSVKGFGCEAALIRFQLLAPFSRFRPKMAPSSSVYFSGDWRGGQPDERMYFIFFRAHFILLSQSSGLLFSFSMRVFSSELARWPTRALIARGSQWVSDGYCCALSSAGVGELRV